MTDRDDGLPALFRSHLPHFDWTVIETGLVTPGVPDHNACYNGIEFWVEFKATKTMSIRNLDPLQVAWIHRRFRAGGRVWIAVRRRHEGGKRLGDPVDELWLIYGGNVLELAQNGLELCPRLVTGRWRGGPARWDWCHVGKILMGNA